MTPQFLSSWLLRRLLPAAFAGLALASASAAPTTAYALSEIQRQDDAPAATDPPPSSDDIQKVPLPAPLDPAKAPAASAPADSAPADQTPSDRTAPGDDEDMPQHQVPDQTAPENQSKGPLPDIEYDFAKLPEPVRKMREAIIEAAKTGDIEKLRPLLGTTETPTQLSLGGIDGDPVQFLKEQSGDEGGQEILAILEDVLSAGYVHMKPDGDNDFYVWPYFAALPVDRLTAPQRVELFRIVTAGDLEDMREADLYNFYRVGITPDGKWSFFVTGE